MRALVYDTMLFTLSISIILRSSRFLRMFSGRTSLRRRVVSTSVRLRLSIFPHVTGSSRRRIARGWERRFERGCKPESAQHHQRTFLENFIVVIRRFVSYLGSSSMLLN